MFKKISKWIVQSAKGSFQFCLLANTPLHIISKDINTINQILRCIFLFKQQLLENVIMCFKFNLHVILRSLEE